MLLIGTSSGRLYIYKITDEILKLKKILTDHESGINYVYICNRLKVFATVSMDRSCLLYTYPNIKLFNIITNDSIIFDYCFISASYLPSLILYSKQNYIFYSYSINGKYLYSCQDGVKYLLCPRVITDISQQDYLVKFINLDIWY